MNFHTKGYAKIENFLSKELRTVATHYAFIDEKLNFKSTLQVPGAHSRYADPLMESILISIKPSLEEVVGLNLLPTYSYFRVYREGHALQPHKDRDSCEISVTVNLGQSPNSDIWSIYMDGEPILLDAGDAAVYRGCDVEHWREPAVGDDFWCVQGFFHYVNKDEDRNHFALDGREFIGQQYQEKKGYITYL